MPTLDRDDTQLCFDDWGAGKPVVFVRGWSLGDARPAARRPFSRP